MGKMKSSNLKKKVHLKKYLLKGQKELISQLLSNKRKEDLHFKLNKQLVWEVPDLLLFVVQWMKYRKKSENLELQLFSILFL